MAFIKVNLPFGDNKIRAEVISTFEFKQDVSQINRNGLLKALNSIYFDNSLNPFSVRLTAEDTQWTALIPAGSQGWLSCVATINSILSATLIDTTLLPVSTNNTEVQDDIYPQNTFLFNQIYINNNTSTTSNFPVPCNIFLSDSYHQNEISYPEPPLINNLGGEISLNSVKVNNLAIYYFSISGTVISVNLNITPTTYTNFYCTNISGIISPDATLAVAGIETISTNISGTITSIFQFPLQTTPLSGVGVQFSIENIGTIVEGSAAGQIPSISISTALASGTISGNLSGYFYPSNIQ